MGARPGAWPVLLLGLGWAWGCGADSDSTGGPRLAYVTNGVADFWTLAAAGARTAAREHGARVDVLMPAGGIGEQKSMVEDCLTKAVDGIAISPIDPANQGELIARAAERAHLITHDSDAPGSARLCYVGMDNYQAGRLCGELLRGALPEGGKVALFIGRLEQENGRLRRQGLLDAVLGRDSDRTRFDPPDGALTGPGGVVVVGTYTDQFDRARGKANVEDALSSHPDLAACAGLFGYSTPLILEALKGSGNLGQVVVVGFDEDEATLDGVAAGHVRGTVVQNPWRYGYESVRILAGLSRGASLAELGVDADGFLNIEARVIDTGGLESFRSELAANLAR